MHDKSNTLKGTPLLADAMLGRLARWLRLMGYDTRFASGLSDHQIVACARSEGRVVLTQDRELARRQGIRCLLIQRHALEEQIREVVDRLGPPPSACEPRCPHCNAPLVKASPDEIRTYVPPYVFNTYEHFRRCADCGKVYWQGSHWEKVTQVIERLLNRQIS
jgi:uncharacterized protein with PIN domain